MTDPARIEAAARAICAKRGVEPDELACVDWQPVLIDGKTQPNWRIVALYEVTPILAAAYPELANGTAWLAPMEATDEMLEAARGAWSWPDAWTAMRDAHLKAQGSDA